MFCAKMSSNEEDLVVPISRRARKRKRNVDNRQITRAKRARNTNILFLMGFNCVAFISYIFVGIMT